jgi:hypothetical protein
MVDGSGVQRLQVAEQMTFFDFVTICAIVFFVVTVMILWDKRNGKW